MVLTKKLIVFEILTEDQVYCSSECREFLKIGSCRMFGNLTAIHCSIWKSTKFGRHEKCVAGEKDFLFIGNAKEW